MFALLVGELLDVVVSEELDELVDDRELDEASSALLELLVVASLAVGGPSSLPSSTHSATPTAASTTTPATISAIRVFRLPFGGGPPEGPQGGRGRVSRTARLAVRLLAEAAGRTAAGPAGRTAAVQAARRLLAVGLAGWPYGLPAARLLARGARLAELLRLVALPLTGPTGR